MVSLFSSNILQSMDQILSLIPHRKSVNADGKKEMIPFVQAVGFWVSSKIKGKSNTGFQGLKMAAL